MKAFILVIIYYLLGRMAGVDEKRLQQLVTSGKVEEILNRLQAK